MGGNALEQEKFDLALQSRPRRRRGFFWDGELDTSKKHSFRDDDVIYGLSDIGLLRVRIDVSVYENSRSCAVARRNRDDELDIEITKGSFSTPYEEVI
jgi:hypothetical protein